MDPNEIPGGTVARRVERWALAALLVAVPLAFATGLSRYEVAKLAVLAVLGSVAVVAFTLDFCRGRAPRLLGAWLAAAAGAAFVAAGTLSLLWGPDLPEAGVAVLRWTLLVGVFVVAAARTAGPEWIAGPLVLAGGVTALLVVGMRLGLGVPPPVPTGMAWDAGLHGPFDHEVFAGAYLAVVGPVALYGAANAVRRAWRGSYLGAALLVYLALGMTGSAGVALGIGSLLLGLALSARRLRGVPGGLLVWGATMGAVVLLVLGRFGLGGLDPEPEAARMPNLAPSLYESIRLEGAENAVTSGDEWRFAWSQARAAFSGAAVVGEGVGSYASTSGQSVDAASPYYGAARREYHTHDSPPGVVAGFLAEQGLLGLLLGGLFLGLAVGAGLLGFSRVAPGQAPGAGYLLAGVATAVVVLLLTPALYHAGEGVAVMAVLGLAARLSEPAELGRGVLGVRRVPGAAGAFQRFERWALLGAPLLLLVAWGIWQAGFFTANDYVRQRGELYLMAQRTEEAIASLEGAAELEPRDFRTHYLLGLVRYYTPRDDGRREAARQNLVRAAELRPHDVRVQIQRLKNEMQRGGQDPAGRMSAAAAVRNRLLELRRRDPRNVEVHRQLADVQRALGDYDQAVAALLEVTRLTEQPRVLAETYAEIGEVFSEQLDDPEAARTHYELALDYAPTRSPLAERVAQRLRFVEEWLRRGSRPIGDGGPGHGAGGHEHEHEH
jgi:tetratricopeptide (TPR) repeat protein